MSAARPTVLCDSCKVHTAIAKVEGAGPSGVQWLCRACVADLLRRTAPDTAVDVVQASRPSAASAPPHSAPRPALTKASPVTFQPLSGSIAAIPLSGAARDADADDVSEDSDDDANDAALLETRQFASVPVERLLASIAQRADAAATVGHAKRAALLLRTRPSARDVCGECEVIVLPRQAGAALRFRGVGVLLLSADGSVLKLHAKGRPSGALVLTLNTILSELSGFGRFSVCPSGTEELLLLDSAKKTRVSCDRQRELEAAAASTARREFVRQQSLTLLGEKPPKPPAPRAAPSAPTGSAPLPPSSPKAKNTQQDGSSLLAALQASEAAAESPAEQWNAQNPHFSKMVWYWAKRAMLGALCHEADRAFRDGARDIPFVRAETTSKCLQHCASLMKLRIEKETTKAAPDFRPKAAFISSSARLTFVLDKLFVSGSRALKMNVPFVEVLFKMESHWVQLRGKLIGTTKQPPIDDLFGSASPVAQSRRHTSQLSTASSDRTGGRRPASSAISSTAAPPEPPPPAVPPPPADNGWLSVDVDNVDAILAAYRAQNASESDGGAAKRSEAKPGAAGDSLTRGEAKASRKAVVIDGGALGGSGGGGSSSSSRSSRSSRSGGSSAKEKLERSKSANSSSKSASSSTKSSVAPREPSPPAPRKQPSFESPAMFADDSDDEPQNSDDDDDDDVDLSVIPKLK
jgi:hypothetical protein